MKIKKAYKFRLTPTDEQRQLMTLFAGHCRFLWNKVLFMNLQRLKENQPILWYHEADFWSKLWKRSEEFGFLKEAPAHCLQQKVKDLDKAFRDAFDKTQRNKRLPKKRKLNLHDSFRFPEPKHIHIDNRRIKLPKLGWIRFRKSQAIEGIIKNATVSKHAGHWYVAIQVEQDIQLPLSNAAKSDIDLDMGIAEFAYCSDGATIKPIHAFKRYQDKLAKAQRRLSKKVKFSENWKKQKAKIQRIHSKIAHVRRDFLHKASTNLSKNHAMIVVEALKVNNMSRSARGSIEEPGKQVKAKSGLNKSILDQGWSEFRRQLGYKLNWAGGLLLEVSPQYTSQRCSRCGHVAKDSRQSRDTFCCVQCGHETHADLNAAKNILAAGHAVLACGETGLPDSMKQEPLGTGDLVPA